MYNLQYPHRQLYNQISEYEGEALFRDVLNPWIAANPAERQWIAEFAGYDAVQWSEIDDADSCRIYSLSRISQLLLLGQQRVSHESFAPNVDVDEYIEFFSTLGMQVVEPRAFDPFHHEIHDVQPDAAVSTISISEELVSPLKIGQALFARGLVNLRCPPPAGRLRRAASGAFNPVIAATSRIHWAFRRRNLPCEDASHGWGSNSQWRTAFRIDLDLDDGRVYNVQGSSDINRDIAADSLSFEQRREVLTHRHAVTAGTLKQLASNQPMIDLYRYVELFPDPGKGNLKG